jgi:uncharacterized protein
MSFLPITSIIAGLFALASIPLSLQVSLRRAKLRVSLGEGNDEVLKRRIRAHGNFIENVPLALIAVGLLEIDGAPSVFIAVLAGVFVVSRALHAAGMLYAVTRLRVAGMALQHTAFAVAGLWLLRQALAQM